jgi:exodeoxyribonuclease VII large subunit
LAAQSSLPILTGIGHEIDESILDMIAFRAFKTPTAVADFLIEQQTANDRALIQLRQQTQHLVYQRIEQSLTWLQTQKTRTQWIGHHYLAQQTQQLNHLAMMVQARHPKTLAAQGYVFIEKNNKRLIDSTSIDCNDIIQIYFPDGVINAAVLDKKII